MVKINEGAATSNRGVDDGIASDSEDQAYSEDKGNSKDLEEDSAFEPSVKGMKTDEDDRMESS
jgi:hypothetical protein